MSKVNVEPTHIENDTTPCRRYYITTGTVQCYVKGPALFMHHFGRAEYDISKPVLSETLLSQAQPIVDLLNTGDITETDAKALLDKIRL